MSILKNYKLTLSYEGSCYLGWQKTKMGPSVGEALEKALSQLLQEEVAVQGASRTDRGVHARGQVAGFKTSKTPTLRGINALLPKDIRGILLEEAEESFHPSTGALHKTYLYQVDQSPFLIPQKRHFFWHYPYVLDLEKIRSSIPLLLGRHDFSAFANRRDKNPFCTLFSIEVHQKESDLFFLIRGDRFLYKMVRNLVGTLLYMGCQKLDDMAEVLESRDRKKGGVTAPPEGLFLLEIAYPTVDS